MWNHWNFLSVLAFCLVIVWIVRELKPLIRQALPANETDSEQIEIVEDERPMEPIPPDLLNLALMESEDWARQGVIKALHDAYERCRDWNVVRAAYQVTPTDVS